MAAVALRSLAHAHANQEQPRALAAKWLLAHAIHSQELNLVMRRLLVAHTSSTIAASRARRVALKHVSEPVRELGRAPAKASLPPPPHHHAAWSAMPSCAKLWRTTRAHFRTLSTACSWAAPPLAPSGLARASAARLVPKLLPDVTSSGHSLPAPLATSSWPLVASVAWATTEGADTTV